MNEERLIPEKEEILMNEDELLNGLLTAAAYKEDTRRIRISRGGKPLFEFHIRPLGEDEIMECRRSAASWLPNPAGKKFPKIEGDIDIGRFRCLKILRATTEADRAKIWDNPRLKAKLGVLPATPAEEIIDMVLTAGEKDALGSRIDEVSGFGDDSVTLEEYAKN